MIWPHWKTAENPHVSPILFHMLVIEVKKVPTGIDSYKLVIPRGYAATHHCLCMRLVIQYEVVFLMAWVPLSLVEGSTNRRQWPVFAK